MEGSAYLIFLVLLGMLFSSMPVFLSLLLTGTLGLVMVAGISPHIIVEVMYRSIDKFALVVVLFFILCVRRHLRVYRRHHGGHRRLHDPGADQGGI
jgi:C4-dicarboxylate transporter DctM subunit